MVAEREDGCLIVDPRLPRAGETRSTNIQIEENLRWAITSKYLLGFDEIRIISRGPITNSQRDELKKIIKRFVALEVTDEDDQQIVIQCLVDPSTLPVHKAMRRINLIATRMFNDALRAYFEGNQEIALDVIERDEEVDRLFFLIVRELRSAIQYPRVSERLGITPVEALDFRLAAQYIERIADLAVDIAEKVDDALETKLVNRIDPLVSKVRDMLAKSVTNLFKFDSEKVAQVIAGEKELIDDTLKLRNQLIASPSKSTRTHLYVVDSLLRIGEAAKDIVDLALPQS
ncbi:MAG: phosphate uptake regulator PhoU [Candidatus Thorarchaeota archaeon]|nr:MAG: phosphate uptake regulator PhoU [Candidatus Thorarchaeota archaeon]